MEANNMAAMREALEKIRAAMLVESGMGPTTEFLSIVDDLTQAAVAAPPRNCDVGTAEEQIKRWEKFCLEHHEYWKPSKSLTAIQRCNCPCLEGNGCNYFIWAQMPYKEGDSDGSK